MKLASPPIVAPARFVESDPKPASDGATIRAQLVAAGLLRPGARVVTPGGEPSSQARHDAPTLTMHGPPNVPSLAVGLTDEDAPPAYVYRAPRGGQP